MKNQGEIRYLLEKYLEEKSTQQEDSRLFELLDQGKHTGEWEQLLEELAELQQADPTYQADRWNPLINKVLQRKSSPIKFSVRNFYRSALTRAAAILLLVAAGTYLWFNHTGMQTFEKPGGRTVFKNDIVPGGNRATLTLANGNTLVLDSMHNGLLASQGKTRVIKTSSGMITYNPSSASVNNRPATVQYNTLTTPRGGQYEIRLSDGSRVWLNAASSLQFPAVFAGRERKVILQGEAYFEIKEDALMPFKVETNKAEVTVLGTHFDIKAYSDEPALKTTLLEGSIKIISSASPLTPHHSQLLTPGEQVQVDENGEMTVAKDADTEEAVAWKNGLFEFTSADVEDIMRQVARWYDVTVEYPEGIPSGHITGKIPRNTNLSEVLKMIALSGFHFKIEGRKLIVLLH